MDESVTMPISVINKIRREVLGQLELKRSRHFETREKHTSLSRIHNLQNIQKRQHLALV